MSVLILRWRTFSDNGTMAHEGYVVLQLGSDVGRAERSVDFKIMCALCTEAYGTDDGCDECDECRVLDASDGACESVRMGMVSGVSDRGHAI
jgi:hypothetical protein